MHRVSGNGAVPVVQRHRPKRLPRLRPTRDVSSLPLLQRLGRLLDL